MAMVIIVVMVMAITMVVIMAIIIVKAVSLVIQFSNLFLGLFYQAPWFAY